MEVFAQACSEVPEFTTKLPIIYDAEALYTEREVLRRRLKGNPWSKRDYRNALAKELALTKKAQTVLTVSEHERSLFAAKTHAKVRVLAHGIVATPDPRSFSQCHGMLFVGALDDSSEVSPNVNSLIWFAVNVHQFVFRSGAIHSSEPHSQSVQSAPFGSLWAVKVVGPLAATDPPGCPIIWARSDRNRAEENHHETDD